MVQSRPDISSSIIRDDYIHRRSWNLVCDSDVVQQVSFVAASFLGALNRALSPIIVARLCGSNDPHSLDKQPRVEYIKQYDGNGKVLQSTFGSTLRDFLEQYSIPLDPPQKSTTTDFSRPPRATFAQAHLHKTHVIGMDRASWAAVVYKAAFDKAEPSTNPFHTKRKKKTSTTPTTHASPPPSPPTVTPNPSPSQPTDEPTDTPGQPTKTQQTQTLTQTATTPPSQALLDTTVHKLETNVDKISTSVELIARSQSDLQKKFETFMETTQAAKKQQQADMTSLLHDAMHEHVYPQLNALVNETNDWFAYIETLLERASPASHSSSYESDSDDSTSSLMGTSTTTDVTGCKHRRSPSRTKSTPPPKRASCSLTFSPAATPGRSDANYFRASQDFSGFTEQSQLSGGSE